MEIAAAVGKTCCRCGTSANVGRYIQPRLGGDDNDENEEDKQPKKGKGSKKLPVALAGLSIFACNSCFEGCCGGGHPFLGKSFTDWSYEASQSAEEMKKADRCCEGGAVLRDWEPEEIKSGERYEITATMKVSFVKSADWGSLKTSMTMQNARVNEEKCWDPHGQSRMVFFIKSALEEATAAATEAGGVVEKVDMNIDYKKFYERAKVHLQAGSACRPKQADEISAAVLKRFKADMPPSLKPNASVQTIGQIHSGC